MEGLADGFCIPQVLYIPFKYKMFQYPCAAVLGLGNSGDGFVTTAGVVYHETTANSETQYGVRAFVRIDLSHVGWVFYGAIFPTML